MQIVVTHLIRAPQVSISVAGVDPQQGRFYRLQSPQGRIAPALLEQQGGPFALGNVLELLLRPTVSPAPRIEDRLFDPARVRVLHRLPAEQFWTLLEQLARPTFRALFGPQLRKVGRDGCGADLGQGGPSLGCWRPRRATLWSEVRDQRLQARMRVGDGQLEADVPVKDVRLHRDDFLTPWQPRVDALSQRLQSGEEHLLSLALSERHETSTEPAGAHWLEVDNLFFRHDPYWEFRP